MSAKKKITSPLFSAKPGDTIAVSKKKVVDAFNTTFRNNKKLITDLAKY